MSSRRTEFHRAREESESEYYEHVVHRDGIDVKTLRHVLQTARNTVQRDGREAYDRFCR